MKDKKLLIRIICIILFSLFIGIVFNQLYPQGIPFRLLVLTFKVNSLQKGWNPISADSSYVYYLQKKAYFFDIRSQEQYSLDHLKGAQSLPFYKFINQPGIFTLPEKDSIIILYDFEQNSTKAPIMVQQLEQMGYQHVFFLRNGYAEWLEYGFPVEKGGIE